MARSVPFVEFAGGGRRPSLPNSNKAHYAPETAKSVSSDDNVHLHVVEFLKLAVLYGWGGNDYDYDLATEKMYCLLVLGNTENSHPRCDLGLEILLSCLTVVRRTNQGTAKCGM